MPETIVLGFAFGLLETQVPKRYTYHNLQHTEDVYQAAMRIAKAEGIDGESHRLLLTAALFHDTGFIIGKENHEEHSCTIAREHLPAFGYTPWEIDEVCRLIRATKMPQRPSDLLEMVMCDADLDYLGRDDFDLWSNRLYQELEQEGPTPDKEKWRLSQIDFLQGHHYFTSTNKKERTKGKEHNVQALLNEDKQ